MSNAKNAIPQGIMRIYGCGGAGVNIAASWHDLDREKMQGLALVQIAYLDTSRSNLPDSINESSLYLIEDVDGSGKVRRENHVAISRSAREMILQHPPGDLNVVIFSASGGSGSVIGPLVAGELIERGAPVVCLVIGSEESAITCANTLNTLKSMESISKKKSVPLVMLYEHNSQETPRSKADISCRAALAALDILSSRQNSELDTKDLANWLNYPKVTTVEPQLSLLHIYHNAEDVDAASHPVSVASLLKDPDQPTYKVLPEYGTAGYPRYPVDKFNQLHFVITVDGVQVINKMLNERVSTATKAASARVKHDSIVGVNDITTDDGLIL